ncbi:MAG: N-6 DNA methylase [Promethearchaeota archaeon]
MYSSLFSHHLEDNIPISIIPALPNRKQLIMVNETLESLFYGNDSTHQQLFLNLIKKAREKKYHEIFNEIQIDENKLFWRFKKISFIYLQEIPIHKIFIQKKHLYILQSIRNELISDSTDWVCLIDQKSIYMFSLSNNHLLIWSSIIPGLEELFLASLLLDNTRLTTLGDALRWDLIDQVKTQLISFLKRYIMKHLLKEIKEKSVIQRFILLTNMFSTIQKCILEIINNHLISISINEIDDFDLVSKQINNISYSMLISKLENIPTFDSLIEHFYNPLHSFTQTDNCWFLDLHLINFIEIPPQIYSEIKNQNIGGFFTPIELAETIVAYSFVNQQNLNRSITDIKIYDPAAGTGILLVFALEWILNSMMSHVSSGNSFIGLRRKILNSGIYGNDIDQNCIQISNIFFDLFCMKGLKKIDITKNLVQRDFIEFFISQSKSDQSLPKYDVILSNPPYLAFHSRFTKKSSLKNKLTTLQQLIPIFSGKRDNTYLLFLGICLQYFLTSNGVLSFVIDHSFLDLPSYGKIRHFILTNYNLYYVLANYNYKKTAVVDLSLLILRNRTKANHETIWQETLVRKPQRISQNHFLSQPNYMFRYLKAPLFFSRIQENSKQLGQIVYISCGLEYGSLLKTHFLSNKCKKNFYPVIDGSNGLQQSYILFWVPGLLNSYVRFDKNFEKQLQDSNQDISREKKKVIMISGNSDRFISPKIILRQTATKFIATLDDQKFFTLRNTHLIYRPIQPYSLLFILGIMNSSLGNWIGEYLNIIRKPKRKSSRYPQIRLNDLKTFPIVDIDRIEDRSIISQLETTVKECLKTGNKITLALTELWNIFQDSGDSFSSQRQFLRLCLSNEILKHYSLKEQLKRPKYWNIVIQKELSRLLNQKKVVDCLVFRLYGINKEDQQCIKELRNTIV